MEHSLIYCHPHPETAATWDYDLDEPAYGGHCVGTYPGYEEALAAWTMIGWGAEALWGPGELVIIDAIGTRVEPMEVLA